MKKVVMYTLSTCPWCRKAKNFFKEKNVPFEFTDYDLAKPDEQERIRNDMSKFQGSAFPFVKIDGEVIIGFNPERYATLLGL